MVLEGGRGRRSETDMEDKHAGIQGTLSRKGTKFL